MRTEEENHQQEQESSLPSHETVSFAVKSISQEFNWTEAVVFVAGKRRKKKKKKGPDNDFEGLFGKVN